MAVCHKTGTSGGAFRRPGRCVSGQQLAQTLGVSRAAVHKACGRTGGSRVCAGSRPPAGLSAGGRRPLLRRGGGGVRRPHLPLRQAGKLQPHGKDAGPRGYAPRHAGADKPADAGRGRLGRRFESPAGKGIYLSLVLRPGLPMTEAQAVTVSAAVAVCRAVKKLCGLDLASSGSTTCTITARRSAAS